MVEPFHLVEPAITADVQSKVRICPAVMLERVRSLNADWLDSRAVFKV
jgi:hypothetical protein